MIAEFKKHMKLMKYGYNFKPGIIGAAVLMLGGICLYLTGMFSLMSSIYIIFGLTSLLSIEETLLISGLVASSPKKRGLEIWGQDILQLVLATFGFLLIIFLDWIQRLINPELEGDGATNFIMIGLVIAMIQVYWAFINKSYLFGIIIGAAVYLLASIMVVNAYIAGYIEPSFLNGLIRTDEIKVVVGFFIVLAGCLIAGWIRRLLYKKPLSKYMMAGELRKEHGQ